MDTINDFFSLLSNFLWGWPMIILLLGTHIYLTFRLRVPQRKLLTGIRLSVQKDKDAPGDVSQFGALATALAATIGTGNIVGVATAVALGGPGAVLWCWLTGIFGMSTKYAEGLLAVKYRVKGDDGRTYGGPMYALERGLGMKWLAMLFAVFTALASFGIGCTVQANSIALLANETFGVPTWAVGLFVCLLTALVIMGGVKAIARVCTVLVPFMAVLYVLGCVVILCMNSDFVWPALKLIVSSAFNPSAAGGGFVGATVMMAARYGIARGLFSNESGMGSAPIVAAAAQTRNPVRQALVSSTGTFWDTVIICALTGLVLVSSILAYPDISYADGAALTKVAFSKIPYVGAPLLAFGILTFAFSTILGWSYYGESAVNYIEHQRMNRFYRILYIVALFFGSIISLDIIWNIADCMNALMAIPNLVALLLLSGVAARETKKYLWSGRLDDEMKTPLTPRKKTLVLVLLALTPFCGKAEELKGTVIGTSESVNYATNQPSTTVNTCAMAFDGNYDTFFASWDRSYTWAGLDLGRRCIITKVGWAPRSDSNGPKRTLLGLFEGANREDFADALPLHIITKQGRAKQMSYADVDCSLGFRYVRYVGPADARCNIAELVFYGRNGDGDSTRLVQLTNLPTVSIHTADGQLPYDKEHQIEAQLTVVDSTGLLSEPGTIRERGNASRGYPKKPYRIKFDKKQRMPGSTGKAKKWTLINNYGDKTLMRNLLAFDLSQRLGMPYTPYGIAVDVILNGEYKGCYQLCDQVQVHKHRINIEEMTTADNSGTALTGGYLLEVDAYAYDEESWFNSSQRNPVTIKSPEADSITSQQRSYIENHFNKMESQWTRYLDLDTFLRHFLVGELSGNTDTYWSVFMYKHRGNDTIYTGPVWDFDLAFENDNRTYPVCNKNDYIYRSGGSCAGNMRSFVDKIVINNAAARNRMKEIWDEARHHGLTEEQLVAVVDSLEATLQQSQQLNFTRWPIMNQKVHQNPRTWGSYQAEVENVRRFVKERLAWMDKRLGYTYIPTGIANLQESDATIDLSRPYRVYTISGQPCGNDINAVGSGIFIIRQGAATQKIKK